MRKDILIPSANHRVTAFAALALCLGTVFLWLAFGRLGDLAPFVALSSAVVVTWVVGWFYLMGRTHGGVPELRSRRDSVWISARIAVIVCCAFVVGTLVLLRIDGLSDGVRSAVVGARETSLLITFVVALGTGAAEELFFRVGLPRLWSGIWAGQLVSCVLYTLSTAVTGNVALVAAAPLLGLACSYAYLRTGRAITPILVHAAWTFVMVGALPQFL